MNALGIVAEFNPFHSGHKYLIDTASALTEADVCVSVMSGFFTQRGDIAFYDKWSRAETAVRNGVDLVVELPQVYSCSSAKYFASSGVRHLENLGCKYLAFGSESGDLDELTDIAKAINHVEAHRVDDVRLEMAKGYSYPRARENVLRGYLSDDAIELARMPNNILGIEYISSILSNDYKILPIAVQRKGDGHLESASSLRNKLLDDPEERTRIELRDAKLWDLIRYRILSLDGEKLDEFDSANEGLGNKAFSAVRKCRNLEELIEHLTGKRYPRTRVSRFIIHILLGIRPELYNEEITYVKPLAMNEKGRAYLRELKSNSDLIFIDNIPKTLRYKKDNQLSEFIEIDIKAGDVFAIANSLDLYSESDYVRKPQVLQTEDN